MSTISTTTGTRTLTATVRYFAGAKAAAGTRAETLILKALPNKPTERFEQLRTMMTGRLQEYKVNGHITTRQLKALHAALPELSHGQGGANASLAKAFGEAIHQLHTLTPLVAHIRDDSTRVHGFSAETRGTRTTTRAVQPAREPRAQAHGEVRASRTTRGKKDLPKPLPGFMVKSVFGKKVGYTQYHDPEYDTLCNELIAQAEKATPDARGVVTVDCHGAPVEMGEFSKQGHWHFNAATSEPVREYLDECRRERGLVINRRESYAPPLDYTRPWVPFETGFHSKSELINQIHPSKKEAAHAVWNALALQAEAHPHSPTGRYQVELDGTQFEMAYMQHDRGRPHWMADDAGFKAVKAHINSEQVAAPAPTATVHDVELVHREQAQAAADGPDETRQFQLTWSQMAAVARTVPANEQRIQLMTGHGTIQLERVPGSTDAFDITKESIPLFRQAIKRRSFIDGITERGEQSELAYFTAYHDSWQALDTFCKEHGMPRGASELTGAPSARAVLALSKGALQDSIESKGSALPAEELQQLTDRLFDSRALARHDDVALFTPVARRA